jgi:hypothetical protein
MPPDPMPTLPRAWPPLQTAYLVLRERRALASQKTWPAFGWICFEYGASRSALCASWPIAYLPISSPLADAQGAILVERDMNV